MKLFLDTNLLIDYFASRIPYRDFFMKLLAMNEFGDAELWVSAKSFTDVFYVCKKHVPSRALQQAFSNCGDFLRICSIGEQDIMLAANRAWPDFEDCLVAIAAEKVKADYLVTRDLDGFRDSKVPVLSPQGLLDTLERDYGLVYDCVEIADGDSPVGA